MKLILKLAGLFSLTLGLSACSDKKTTISISYSGENQQIQFAIDSIKGAALKADYSLVDEKGDYQIIFNDIDQTIKSQDYHVQIDGKIINLTSGDETGLMYAGLDIYDKLLDGTFSAIASYEVTHDIDFRGLKFNCPLDMRTPSYSDGGDSGQTNILDMWDETFWQSEFDNMAKDRFNALSLWNLNPFPSMIKIEDYPNVALNDVWRTTVPFGNPSNGTGSDLVKDSYYEEGNYEVLKKISIDEKISFWQKVMKMAHNRGIKFYIYTWNVYTFGEHGNYGITEDQDNLITKDYYTKSVETLINTYPDLDGLGIGAGENMKVITDVGSGSMGSGSGNEENEIWLHDTYGIGIKNALAKNPSRDFEVIHRMHYADGNSLASIWNDIPCTFNLSDKYSIAHMYASEKPLYVDETINNMTENQQLWLELRNDDTYFLRYGGYRFLKSLISQMPSSIKGFLLGSDGYIQGREYTSTDEAQKGEMYIEKHWYNYSLIGRIGYQKSLDEQFFKNQLRVHYNISKEKTEQLFAMMNAAGEIIPNSNMLFFTPGDSWLPELSWNNPNTLGYLNIKRLMKANSIHPYGSVISIPNYCLNIINNQTTDKRTPIDIINNLNTNADKVLLIQQAHFDSLDTLDKPLREMIKDQLAYANLGKYYAEKYEASISLRLYNDLKDDAKKEEAVNHATKSSVFMDTYCADMIARYNDNHVLSRCGVFSFTNIQNLTKDEISFCQKWMPRTL